ncbi:putative penicillin-binding protein 1B, partial [Vibrio parahaemolyticus V-223/04]
VKSQPTRNVLGSKCCGLLAGKPALLLPRCCCLLVFT